MKPAVRLIAVDIDGTLLNSQFHVSPANLEALHGAHRLGVEVVIVTGRRHGFALPIVESLGLDVCLISSNGAVTRSLQGELFHRDLLPAATARTLIAKMDSFRANALIAFDSESSGALVVEGVGELHTSISRWMEKNASLIEHVVPLEKALVTDPVQVMFCGTVERMRAARQSISASGLAEHITLLKTEYVARDLCILDVLTVACSKGHALARWAQHRGYARHQVMAIGDNHNDVEMLDFAGMPFIMGNACEELKQNGWAVTLTNDQSGVAAAIGQALGI